MLRLKWATFCVIGLLVAAPAAIASFTMTNPGVTGAGSGNSMGTAAITSEGPWDVQEPGFGADATVTPTGTAISFQQSHAIAWDGTATASTSGTITETGSGVNTGDSVTATTAGSTSATAQKENDPVRAQLWNEATSTLLAAGGAGGVLSNFFTTSTGFMAAAAQVETDSTGSIDATAGTDASGSSKGSASVAYTFAGSGSAETLNLSNADVAATADVDGDTTVAFGSTAHGEADAAGVFGWTGSETAGLAFGAFLNLDSETLISRQDASAENGLPSASADAAGDLDLNFVYRPFSEFLFLGNVNGSTDSESEITQGVGDVESQGIKAAVGTAGTQTELSTGVMAWIAGNVRMVSFSGQPELFDAAAEGHAVNPAVLGEAEFDPDPSMTVGTQYGEFSAAIGSSSLVNAEVTATGVADESEWGDTLLSSAFAFAVAFHSGNDTVATSGVEIYDLAGPYAFVGQGSITALDEAVPDGVQNGSAVSATVLNVFGAASTPGYFGSINNGDSGSTIGQDDDFVIQRAASASADSVSGTNYPVAVAHNQMFGYPEKDANSPWFEIFFDVEVEFDHLAVGFIGAGGN